MSFDSNISLGLNMLAVSIIVIVGAHRRGYCTSSVDTCGKEEVLDDGNHLKLAEIVEELVELFLISAVKNQVGTEDKDASRQDRQHLERLETNDSVQEQVDLVDLERADEGVVDPWEGRTQRVDAQLVHVIADFRLVHLQ